MANFNNSDLFRVIMKRKFHLLIIVVAAALLGLFFSSETFIKPKFKSTAIVYPVNIIPYSLESPTEQLLQLFHSADVRAMMITKFNLAKYYGIESSSPAAITRLNNEYDDNVMIRKTEYESIKIDICDVNPDTACAMVNGIIHCVDIKARMLQREKTKEVVKIFRDQLLQKQKQIDSLEKIDSDLRITYGLLDFKSQSKEATKSYLKMVSDGAAHDRVKLVDSLMRNLEEKGGVQISVSDQLKGLRKSYNDIKEEYDKAISDLTKELTYSNVVTLPSPADAKCYPVRSLIALVFAVTTLLLSIIIFVIIDRRTNNTNVRSDN
jgi:hypothetical protein